VSYLTVIVVGMTPCSLVITDVSEKAAGYVFARFEFIRNVSRYEVTRTRHCSEPPDFCFINLLVVTSCCTVLPGGSGWRGLSVT
jgi:hypothetical protein